MNKTEKFHHVVLTRVSRRDFVDTHTTYHCLYQLLVPRSLGRPLIDSCRGQG